MSKLKSFILTSFLFACVSLFAQIPSGYYNNASGKTGTNLQSALHTIIDGHSQQSYPSLWTHFQSTDVNASGKVWDMYSDVPGGTPSYTYTFVTNQCGNYSGEGSCYNREHSFPKSWFNDGYPMYSDLFHLYPTDGYVNGQRGSYPFGEVSSPTWTSTNGSKRGPNAYPGSDGQTCFEPIDEYKGDFARTYFYMATRYYGEDGSWQSNDMVNGAEPTTWAMNMLLEWHTADPVSQKELDRNDAVYGIQGNRNPFIDHPEYAAQIWDGAGPNPTVDPEPSNHVSKFAASYIDLSWTDAVGSSLPEGYLVLVSSVSYNDITVPVDGNDPSSYNGYLVGYGVEELRITNLQPQTTYYIKLYPYNGSGAATLYKTDGSVPQGEFSTQ